jgi:hypothetical protein
MNGITQIQPPIAFHRRDGRTVMFRDSRLLAEWLDKLYDAILDPSREDGEGSWSERSERLHEIELVIFALAEESGGAALAISGDLRQRCVELIARYRKLAPIHEPQFTRQQAGFIGVPQ